MVRQQRIPILKSNTYQKSYFKQETARPSLTSSSNHYFEINKRCLCKESIAPHRLDFYMVFLVTRGEGTHTSGSKEHHIHENMLGFIGPDMVNSWQAEMAEQHGFFVSFSESFFNEGHENKHFLQQLPFYHMDGNSVLRLNEEQTSYYLNLLQLMLEEYQNGSVHSAPILRAQLQLLLHKANAQVQTDHAFQNAIALNSHRMVKSFRELYLRDFHNLGIGKGLMLKKVKEYAEELGVSQNHLNDTVKLVTGRSAGQLIRQQLIHHVTGCLMHADKSISEIAYALGFEDPSYFARFYKSQTGKSPTEFREAQQSVKST
ncbi:MAG TPA: helix-turn-helix transcriptional regulator [Cyclobacteriaceae bacterium]